MTVLKEEVTSRLQTMAFLLDAISSLHNAGIISDEKACEKANCYINHIDDVMKIAESEIE
ncbi:MAG: hypothetical protein PHF86_08610 [Candidatus Nanoarchaeia archaeon]|jgi:hypothetical protein|nr:hypothetical protein [Candidatus Nanoarchaeia archaeon]